MKPITTIGTALALSLLVALPACGEAGNDDQAKTETKTESAPAEKAEAPKEAPKEAPALQVAANQPPAISLVPIAPGGKIPVDEQSEAAKRLDGDPAAIAIGKQLFTAFNCSGCHANGGGGMGPALMDKDWIYGDSMENIAASIREGRPNGMPAFRELVPGDTAYQLAAFIRSLNPDIDKEPAYEQE
ncbi:c-type cytochrome [Methyloligella sp. 2.7D]|uniref:c-type cytochrome n=1 Tax=unclassified Methyloligella TaxID=2625955 RepID=UPI00157BBA5C|nr:c-type cytochrome [Methyloligella sp. GL2]QKP76527.1 c-type cytochrome [Methyloligella sp. GL2]